MTPDAGGDDDRTARGDPSVGVDPDGEHVDGWPVDLAGVTETVVATRGPNDCWNHAALGIEPAEHVDDTEEPSPSLATARTWGRTRTRRNLEAGRDAYVQFTRDPVDFVVAALDVHETAEPLLERTDAWVRVDATAVESGIEDGTPTVDWHLEPIEAGVRRQTVPTLDRGRAAVIEATVAASRLDVDTYDEAALLDRLVWLESVVERCGTDRDRAAFELIDDRSDWRRRGASSSEP